MSWNVRAAVSALKIRPALAGAVLLALAGVGVSTPALAAGDQKPARDVSFSFDGPFGTFDRSAAQRGYQVYKEACAACHALEYVSFRNLRDLGFSEAEVKALAEESEVEDGPDDYGEMFMRPRRVSDRLPAPFPNIQAARAANNGAAPPDLSLITKARHNGPAYVYSLLTGYQDPPEGHPELAAGMSYNPYFPGGAIAMPQPLSEDQVSYADGTPTTLEQMAHDVATFLHWAAEPKLEERKNMGVKVFLFLIALTIVLYFVKKRVWRDLAH